MKKPFSPALLFVLTLLSPTGVPVAVHAAEDNPTAYTAIRLVSKELGADSLGRVVSVGGREGVPQPYLWRVTLAGKPGGGGGGGGPREIEVAGGRIVTNRPARGVPADAVVIDLKNLNLDSSGAFKTADAEARRLRLPFNALNYELRPDPAAGNRPVWTVQLLDGDHRPLGTLALAAADGAQLRATGRLAGNGIPASSSAVVASTTGGTAATIPADEPPPVSPPRRTTAGGTTTTTVTTTTTTRRPGSPPSPPEPTGDVDVDVDDTNSGGFMERAGRTLDRAGRTLERTPGRVERSVRRAGANVGASIERFFRGDEEPERRE